VRVCLRESAERERKSHCVGTDYRATEYFNPVDGDEVCVRVCVRERGREGERKSHWDCACYGVAMISRLLRITGLLCIVSSIGLF